MNKIFAIRGAITVDENTEMAIKMASVNLVKTLRVKNKIEDDEIISITTSSTVDITKAYPVKFMRESPFIPSCTPFFSSLEPSIEGSLPLCIRIIVLIQKEDVDFKAVHFYLRGAKVLRPDLLDN